ncbi:hypothetical protein AGMMS50262_21690 [Bacteroidia bacterium]|nr:hypothetical protein AGMMS50262_21690 [Bacteroidia bacterium]
MISIGLIDSGINVNHPLITRKNCIVNGCKGDYEDFGDLLGHGTQCAHLIMKMGGDTPIIYNNKVFDKTLKTSTKNILDALQWCIDNNIKLINLSLSVSDLNYYYEFKSICAEAYKKGIIIVASADNIGRPCLPAYLENVLGVGVVEIENENKFYYADSSIQLYSDGTTPINTSELVTSATSFATARMTGLIATILQENPNIGFDQLKNILKTKSCPYKKEKILIQNKEVDLSKYTIPIRLSKNISAKAIAEELKSISAHHIINNQKMTIALINLSNNMNILDVELKIKEKFKENNHEIVQISYSTQSEVYNFEYSFSCYEQIPEKLYPAYAKALIESANNEYPEAELIIIGMNKPIVSLDFNSINFFDTYTIPELALLSGFQIDSCIFIVDEITEFEYIQKNINCIKNLFDADVIFLIYSSLFNLATKKNMTQHIPDFEKIKQVSQTQFIKLQKKLKDKLNISIYNIDDELQNIEIYNKLLEV